MSDSKLLNPIAYYVANGKKHEIKASDLTDKDKYQLAKTVNLTDEAELLKLWPRVPEGKRPHFYARSSSKRRVSAVETDPAHNAQIKTILDKLSSIQVWKVMVNVFIGKHQEKEILLWLDNYQWGKEVHRICSSELVIRHDLFGQSTFLAMSVSRPWVAIEVINSHYPEEQSFREMLKLSSQVPLLILFDIINVTLRNYFLKVDERTEEITPLYYIYEGSMWKGGTQRKDIDTATRFKIEVSADEKRLSDQKRKKVV
ncbi:hypothetical protein [Geotalea sp. SG265]|uniref:hypothetical protein n=1 Tax=Geotalea sp. SG265 TaxID=2922867 RepID=UPI001FB01D56|nr:hypothetical protein [Geotalea sp. SG265]